MEKKRGIIMLKGIAASSGIALGKAMVIREIDAKVIKSVITDVDCEKERFRRARDTAKAQVAELKEQTEKTLGFDKAMIFEAHIAMIEDPEFSGSVEMQIENEKVNSEYALETVVNSFVSIFESMDNEYMRERAADVKDIGGRIRDILMGIKRPSLSNIAEECIIVARDLTPSDTAQMDRKKVLGFATDIGGRTSHSAIMARSLEIPAVVGMGSVTEAIVDGDFIIVDGDEGIVIVNPDEKTVSKYKSKQGELALFKRELIKYRDEKTISKDGHRVELAGNIGTPEEADNVLNNGGEGVGLFRTEFLYMGKESLPTEEEQFEAYREALEKMGGKPVVIRTLDIGGDKKLSYLKIDDEMNPFLGYRAIRLCLDRTDIFRTQLKALFKASAFGNLKIMFPMISSLQELRKAKEIALSVKDELRSENIAFDENVEIGIMVEIPSAAVISDILAREADFFSIGTNDLIQYTTAVDRMNEKISYLYDPLHPAVLRLIKMVIDNGHKEGKWVGMCGEMAGDLRVVPVLLGMGLDEFSMSPSSILKVRKAVMNISFEKAEKLASEVIKLGTPEEIGNLIEGYEL